MSRKVDNDKIFRKLFYYVYSGEQKCFTCSTTGYLGENLQLGHYLKRKHSSVAWHPTNTRPQCISCNQFHDGREKLFRENLIKEVGIYLVEDLEQLGKLSLGSQHNRDISYKMDDLKQEYRKLDPNVVKEKLIEMNG